MYQIKSYRRMLADRVRRRAYAEALRSVIRPGSVVAEIGTGPGVFALLAAKLGARKVYALEPNPSVELGRRLAERNGVAGVVEFLAALSTEVEPPEPVDVVFSDLRGALPLFKTHLPTILDARRRWLKPGGVLVPAEDRLWATLVSAEDTYRELTEGWDDGDLELDLGPAVDILRNTPVRRWFAPGQCLAEPELWTTVDYRTFRGFDFSGKLAWTAERAGTVHGVALWFDAELAPAAGFSNAPGAEGTIYGQTLFPFPRPLDVRCHDRVEVDLRACLAPDGEYVWRWTTVAEEAAGRRTRFEQTSFQGAKMLEALARKRRLEAAGTS